MQVHPPDVVNANCGTILAPDGQHMYLTMPHVAVGETPGIAVFDVQSRELLRLIEPAKGNDRSDFHGVAVRLLH